jgi:hypothetical protein
MYMILRCKLSSLTYRSHLSPWPRVVQRHLALAHASHAEPYAAVSSAGCIPSCTKLWHQVNTFAL